MEYIQIIFIVFLAIFVLWLGMKLGYRKGEISAQKKFDELVPKLRKDAIQRSRAVLSGQFAEQLSPYLPDFPYKPTEARFIGKPIDFLVFSGIDEKEPEEVIFVEVKSGDSRLSAVEKKLKDLIIKKKVKWEEYRIPKGLTEKRDKY